MAERNTPAGIVSQCHIDRRPPSSPFLRRLIDGGRAVIGIPHKVMRAQAIAMAAMGYKHSGSRSSRSISSEAESMFTNSDPAIPSGTPRSMRNATRGALRMFQESSSAVLPAESVSPLPLCPSGPSDEETGTMMSTSDIQVTAGSPRHMWSTDRSSSRKFISERSGSERSVAVTPCDARTEGFSRSASGSDNSDDSHSSEIMVSRLELLLSDQCARLENNEQTRRNFEDRWE